MKEKVLVAMSGGVDSSFTALLLKEQGFEISGATLSLLQGEKNMAVEDARQVADFLSIPHLVLDMRKDFENIIIENFFSEYSLGHTPNPCVLCNQEIKFGLLMAKAEELGFSFLATGHYARLAQNQYKRRTFFPAKDTNKDQSYYLYRVSQKALAKVLFPLGNYVKEEVRTLAKQHALPVAEKKESQDICFVENNDYREFLHSRDFVFQKGNIVNSQGQILAEHEGKENYTVGQRKGLGIAAAAPLYVSEIRDNGDVVVAEKTASQRKQFFVEKPNFMGVPEDFFHKPTRVLAQIRYHSLLLEAEVEIFYRKHANQNQTNNEQGLHVILNQPVQGITPGQSAVFYDKDDKSLLAGGIIASIQSSD